MPHGRWVLHLMFESKQLCLDLDDLFRDVHLVVAIALYLEGHLSLGKTNRKGWVQQPINVKIDQQHS
jgi:hypothetical protein